MMEHLYPKTKSELIRVLQKMRINKIEVLDDYSANDEANLKTLIKELSSGNHDLTIVLVSS